MTTDHDRQFGARCGIYEWNTSEKFLLPNVIPYGCRIRARLDDTPQEIVSRLNSDINTFFFHLDLSLSRGFPRNRRKLINLLLRRGVKVMNGGVTDIRKRTIQRFCRRLGLNSLLANRRQSPDQLVIVKTNLNYGGEKEDVLSKEEKTELGLPLGKPVIESAMDYKVMALSEVDEALWTDERLTIEKYVTNSEDKIFRFYVMKRSVVLTEAINPRLIKKMVPGLTRREYFLRLLERGFRPGAIRDRRLNKLLIDAAAFIIGFQLDFGTVEAVMSDEADPYIIDVTTTPYWGKESRTEVLDFLRTGIG